MKSKVFLYPCMLVTICHEDTLRQDRFPSRPALHRRRRLPAAAPLTTGNELLFHCYLLPVPPPDPTFNAAIRLYGPFPAASPYGEAECREEGGERGARDVDDHAPAVRAFLGHNGFGWFGGFMSRSLRLM